MMTRYWDRRRFIRVPASGPARWCAGSQQGHCEIADVSPGGVSLRMPARRASQLDARISLEVPLAPNLTWHLAKDAYVVRRNPGEDGTWTVGVAFTHTPCDN